MAPLSLRFITFLGLVTLVLGTPPAPKPPARKFGLNIAAKRAGKLYFGSATDNPELADLPYAAQLSNTNDFGQLTAANSMKWESIEPFQGVFNFTGGDQIANLAKKNGQLMRGHNCVWHNQLAPWVTAGNFSKPALTKIVANHCGTIVKHYKGQIWDVINEAFNEDGTFRSDVFFDTMGESYIPVALLAARAADPKAKLYINDFNIEGAGPKATGLANLVRTLKRQGIPIDGVGVQAHLTVGGVPSTLQANLEMFTALGVEVAITELDVRMTLPETDALLAQQKADYETVIQACNAVEKCIGVTVWDWTDKFSWVPGAFAGEGAACPWDENLVKKPAYQGIIDGFEKH